ncbi:MAG: hypothetical protein AAGI45_14175 [Cyanobacteria bacterium P01_H01_bin.26]
MDTPRTIGSGVASYLNFWASMTISPPPAALSDSDYIIVGLAHCFAKQDGNVVPIKVLEPVPSAYFEALLQGVPTSYKTLYSLRLGEILKGDQPTANHLPAGSRDAEFCQNFSERALAAARTYQTRADIQEKVPHGESFSDVNFSTEKKRILNASHKVTAEDNVKQHKYTHMTL